MKTTQYRQKLDGGVSPVQEEGVGGEAGRQAWLVGGRQGGRRREVQPCMKLPCKGRRQDGKYTAGSGVVGAVLVKNSVEYVCQGRQSGVAVPLRGLPDEVAQASPSSLAEEQFCFYHIATTII